MQMQLQRYYSFDCQASSAKPCTVIAPVHEEWRGTERRARHARKMEDGGYSQESQVTRKDTSMDYETNTEQHELRSSEAKISLHFPSRRPRQSATLTTPRSEPHTLTALSQGAREPQQGEAPRKGKHWEATCRPSSASFPPSSSWAHERIVMGSSTAWHLNERPCRHLTHQLSIPSSGPSRCEPPSVQAFGGLRRGVQGLHRFDELQGTWSSLSNELSCLTRLSRPCRSASLPHWPRPGRRPKG